MFIGLIMLLGPVVVFLVTLPFLRWFEPKLRKVYQIAGGLLVFLGSGTSFYFAAYTGDQGGIAAYFFQLTVIASYILFSIILTIVNWLLCQRASRKRDSETIIQTD